MAKKKTRKDHIQAANRAHTQLCLFEAVVRILEGGDIKSESHMAASMVINMCKEHQGHLLKLYDAAMAAATR